MIDSWSPFSRRSAALGLLAVAVLTLDSVIFLPWRDQRAAYQQQTETDRSAILRYREGLAKLEAEVAMIKQLRDDPDLQAAMLENEDNAASTMQALIKQAATSKKIDISSLQVLPARKADGLGRQGLAVSLEAPFDRLVALIQAIESQQPMIRLVKLELASKRGDEGLLKVAFTAEGLVPEATP